MQLKTLLSAATLACSAGAVVDPVTAFENDAQMRNVLDAFRQNAGYPDEPIVVRVPCTGCAVAQDKEADGMRVWDEAGDKATDLELEFLVSQDAVLLGGQAIFPPNMQTRGASTAKQIAKSDDLMVTKDDLHLSTHMEFSAVKTFGDSPITATDVTLEIIGIEDKVVHVGTVAFSVMGSRDPGVSTRPYMSQPSIIPTVTTLADAQCTTVICRVKAQIAAKMAAMKAAMGKVKTGCMRMMGMHPHGEHSHHHGKPHHHEQQQEEQQNKDAQANVVDRLKGGPKKFGHHGMNGKKPCPKHAFMRKLMHGITVFTRHILLPVLVGVAAGMAVSALGMVLGQLVFMIWMRLRSRTAAGYVAVYHVVGQEDVEQGVEEEEPLPKYEAPANPPAYSDEKAPETDN